MLIVKGALRLRLELFAMKSELPWVTNMDIKDIKVRRPKSYQRQLSPTNAGAVTKTFEF